ncbi:uncharacterized protein [Musca autumnalis]|uniref:uncharacterized protein n=1 Tax=Musca autumnalis TaxID=221902 RepID=UPI003CF95257
MTYKCYKITFRLSNGKSCNIYAGAKPFEFVELKSAILYRLPEEMKNNGELRYYWIDGHGDEIDIVDSCDLYALHEMISTKFSQVYVGLKKTSSTQIDFPPQPIPNISHTPNPNSNQRNDIRNPPEFTKITYKLLNGSKFTRYFDNCYKHNMDTYLFQRLTQHSHKLRYYWIEAVMKLKLPTQAITIIHVKRQHQHLIYT